MRIEEKQLILPALYIIKSKENTNTSTLIRELEVVFNPSGEDAEILEGRKDTKFSQKVRNLVSHRDTNGMAKYTYFVNGVYSLTSEGEKYLETRAEELDYFFSHKFDYGDAVEVAENISDKDKKIDLFDENVVISEGSVSETKTKKRARSKALRDAAIAYYTVNGDIRCKVCGFSFKETYGELGKDYIEIHHEKPICGYDTNEYSKIISDAIKNVKPLCANCHRMIHRNALRPLTIEELKEKMVKVCTNLNHV